MQQAASPQTKDGYTMIANELLEAIARFHCSGAQKDIILVVLRLTYGFHVKNAPIGVHAIAERTGRNPRRVAQDVLRLVQANVLRVIKDSHGSHPRTIAINKDYKSWMSMRTSGKTIPSTMSETAQGAKPLTERNRSQAVSETAHEQGAKLLTPSIKENLKDNLKDTRGHDARVFLTWWGEEFKLLFKETYLCAFKKDMVLVKAMLGVFDVEELKRRARLYLRDADDLAAKNGYSIGIFKARVQGYGPGIQQAKESTRRPHARVSKAGGATTRRDLERTLARIERGGSETPSR